MKKFLIFSLFCAGALLAAAKTKAESIENFQAAITINPDASIIVNETIDYDFGDQQRHGIFRDILKEQENQQGVYRLEIQPLSVTDGQGQHLNYNSEKNGPYLRLKIGDPDQTVSGLQRYIVSYAVHGAINNFDNHDELYWNVTGNDWTVPIKQASATISGPVGAAFQLSNCYWGKLGDNNSCQHQYSSSSASFSHSNLSAGQGLTVVGGWSKGFVSPTDRQRYQHARFNTLPLQLASLLLPLLVLSWIISQWWRHGRDAKDRGPIVPEYEAPAKLEPAQVNFLTHNYLEHRGLIADIIQLAVLGHLRIECQPKLGGLSKDYRLIRLTDGQVLSAGQQQLLNNLFGKKTELSLSDRQNLSKAYESLHAGCAKLLNQRGYYRQNPKTVIVKYILLAVLLGFFGGLLLFASWLIAGGFFLAAAIVAFIFALLMPARTAAGAQVKRQIAGLKLYLSVAEKDRLNFHNAPEKNPTRFEKLLPYAIALGVEKKWAAYFADLTMTQPSWYHDPSLSAFNAIVFTRALSSFNSSTQANAASGGSGASGGFSGGGGGGGGGGSW